MSELTYLTATVYGHVQGVGFRYFVFQHASQLNLKGYAKNIYDGTVEVIAEGHEHQVLALYDYLIQGPSRSRVDKVEKYNYDYTGLLTGFEIK